MSFRTMIIAGIVVLGIVLTTYCDHGGGGVELIDLPREMADAACSNIMRCCTVGELMEAGHDDVTNMDECKAKVIEWYEILVDQELVAALERGEFKYYPDRARKCVDAMRNASCSADYPESCRKMVEPNTNVGEPCTTPISCIDSRCEGPVDSAVCAVPAKAGETCVDPDVCERGTYCRCPDGTMDCYGDDLNPGTCAAQKELNEACAQYDECKNDQGQYCSPNDICEPYAGEGQPCGYGVYCEDDLICAEGLDICKKPCTMAISELGCGTTGGGTTLLLLLVMAIWACVRFNVR